MRSVELWVWIGNSDTDVLDVLRYVRATDADVLKHPAVEREIAALRARAGRAEAEIARLTKTLNDTTCERDAWKRDFEEELKGRGLLRERFGALPDELLAEFVERLHGDRASLFGKLAKALVKCAHALEENARLREVVTGGLAGEPRRVSQGRGAAASDEQPRPASPPTSAVGDLLANVIRKMTLHDWHLRLTQEEANALQRWVLERKVYEATP